MWLEWSRTATFAVGVQQASKLLVPSFLGRKLNPEISSGVYSAECSRRLTVDIKGGAGNDWAALMLKGALESMTVFSRWPKRAIVYDLALWSIMQHSRRKAVVRSVIGTELSRQGAPDQ